MFSFSRWQLPVLVATALYQAVAVYRENKTAPPGQLFEVEGDDLHLLRLPTTRLENTGNPTVVIEHSLGGVEGYLLLEKIAPFADVCLSDRAGYGWSQSTRKPLTSQRRIETLDQLLTAANISPPYMLVGDSLGSYHMRLYAHQFPEKVAGLVLIDGIHEQALLKMPLQLRLLQTVFGAGFVMSVVGSALGFIRIAAQVGLFGVIKPTLRQFPPEKLKPVYRSFCRPKHWLTMTREIANLDRCGRQLESANDLGDLPIVNVKAAAFFKPTWLSRWLPVKAIEEVRSHMHHSLMQLSTQCSQLQATESSHFVWIDQPELIVEAVKSVIRTNEPQQK